MMVGKVLGNRYELLEKIGEGGMAVVYKAKCRLLNRYVAVKILKDEFSKDKEFVAKFQREATAAASLSDNNIVNIYDVGSEGDINYIVLEYVNGKTLKQIIREYGKLNYKTAVGIALQIAKALECAHRNNIIHRDIKPHNILVTEEGLIKVTDFGIAKASNSVTITNSSRIMGSAHYFSPEQAKGSYVDFRTDIYSFGIVIYEMVTGRVPYDAESPVSVALKHIQEPVVPPKELNDKIPESLNKLILKAIEKEPIKRYQSIKEMLSDLKKIQTNQEINIVTEDFDEDSTRIMEPVRVDERKNNDYGIKENKAKGKKPKRKALIAASIILALVLVGTASYFIMTKLLGDTGQIGLNNVTVPSIIGMTKDEAEKAVTDKKLKFTITKYEKSSKTKGTVTDCYPDSGTSVKVNSEVRVVISGGPDNSVIPDVRGIKLNQAEDIINKSGFKVGSVDSRYDDDVLEGVVITQTPSPDSDLVSTSSDVINLIVSKGPEYKTTFVPDLTDKNIKQATAILENANLKVGNTTEVTTLDKDKDGKIFKQSIDAKSKVKEGTAVDITYYKYSTDEASSDLFFKKIKL